MNKTAIVQAFNPMNLDVSGQRDVLVLDFIESSDTPWNEKHTVPR